jgi:uncharacterized protein
MHVLRRLFQKHSCMGALLTIVFFNSVLFGVGYCQVPALEAPTINRVPTAPRGLNVYITDEGHLLQPEDRQVLQTYLERLDASGIAQIVILTLPNTDQELSDFAPKIFNAWGVGNKEKDNGILILANAERIQKSLSGNRIFVATGLGVQDRLPDALVGRLLDQKALPNFEIKDYSGGIRDTAMALGQVLQGDQALIEELSQPAEETELSQLAKLIFLLIFLFIIFRFRGPGIYIGGGGFGGGGFGDSGGGFGGGFGGGSSDGGGSGR